MSQIDRLKRYIFDQERQTLDALEGRVNDASQRAIDIAEVLPKSIALSQEDDNGLIDSLREPVDECIRDSIKTDPDGFSDALFPVIGPAIRKAVTESMRVLAERLNRTVEHSFSKQGLLWRIESFRTGVPLADIILRDTLIYRVEQVFVIHRESGLLVAHVKTEEVESSQDNDAVSAMLTAIQDFVRDSFGAYEQTDLNTVQIGGRTVWIVYGPQAMVAGVFFGTPQGDLRPDFHLVNEALHRQFSEELEAFDGQRAALEPIEALLRPLLTSDSRIAGTRQKDTSSPRKKIYILGALALPCLMTLWWLSGIAEERRIQAYIRSLSTIPGIVVLSQSTQGGRTEVNILQDPMVTLPEELLSDHELTPEELRINSAAFQSSAPEIVLQKIRTTLKVPDTITVKWVDGVIVFDGQASGEWVSEVRGLPYQWLGIKRIDVSGVVFNLPD